jgi:hypothetical protein
VDFLASIGKVLKVVLKHHIVLEISLFFLSATIKIGFGVLELASNATPRGTPHSSKVFKTMAKQKLSLSVMITDITITNKALVMALGVSSYLCSCLLPFTGSG